jgi:phytoene dehydrogenase-like protein
MIKRKQADEHDVILLGCSVGNLVAGTLLSRGRLSVLLLKEQGYPAPVTYSGYRFVPFGSFSEKIWTTRFVKRLFHDLHLPIPTHLQKETAQTRGGGDLPGDRVTFQIILPGARIDLFHEPARMEREWRREFPGEVSQIEKLFTEVGDAASRLKEERKGKRSRPFFPLRLPSFLKMFQPSERLLDLSPFSEEFQTCARLQLLAWGNLIPTQVSMSLASYLLSTRDRGEWMSDVDLEAWRERVFQEFLRVGGRVEEIDVVEEISKRWGKGFAMRLGGDRRIVRSQALILGVPLQRVVTLPGTWGRRLAKMGKCISPRYILYPLFIGVRAKGIPVGMRERLISIQNLTEAYDKGNLLLLSLSPKEDTNGAPQGGRALTVESLISWEKYEREWSQADLDQHRDGVLKHLYHLMPFLENHIEFLEVDSGREWISHWSYPHFLYESSSQFHWRDGLIPCKIGKKLYVIGRQNFPHLGLEGEVLSGLMAAHEILKREGGHPWRRGIGSRLRW